MSGLLQSKLPLMVTRQTISSVCMSSKGRTAASLFQFRAALTDCMEAAWLCHAYSFQFHAGEVHFFEIKSSLELFWPHSPSAACAAAALGLWVAQLCRTGGSNTTPGALVAHASPLDFFLLFAFSMMAFSSSSDVFRQNLLLCHRISAKRKELKYPALLTICFM